MGFITQTMIQDQTSYDSTLRKSFPTRFLLFVVMMGLPILVSGEPTTSLAQMHTAADRGKSKNAPRLKITIPSRHGVSEFYFVQPVNVVLENPVPGDPMVGLTLTVLSNPEGHRKVFSARFDSTVKVFKVATYVRLAGEDAARIRAVAKLQSGTRITASGRIALEEGVDFGNARSLTRRLRMNVIGLKGPVGTARARLWQKNAFRQFSAIISHPMLPRIGKHAANRLVSLEVEYREAMLMRMQFGDAISNDPYVDLRFKDPKPGSGSLRIQWKDTAGKTFEPARISVK